jgi:hypothetical protein
MVTEVFETHSTRHHRIGNYLSKNSTIIPRNSFLISKLNTDSASVSYFMEER